MPAHPTPSPATPATARPAPWLRPGAVRWPDDGAHHLLVGAPQSGKTTSAIHAFVDYIRAHGPTRAVFLTPTRQRAAHLQDIIARAFGGTTGQLLVRTPASLAFGLLRQGAHARGEPAPTLITGPEQDQVLAELIAGHIDDRVNPGWPEEITPQVLSLRAFRDELRDVLMRAAEAGLDGPGLSAVGQSENRPEWVAAGRLLSEYTAVTVLGETTPDRGARYDAATILDRAARELAANDSSSFFDAVVHDDYQDATLATSRLLGALARRGSQLLLTSNPDTGVQGFRGGLPALTHAATLPAPRSQPAHSPPAQSQLAWSQDGALGARVHVLDTVHMSSPLWSAVGGLSDGLPSVVGSRRRRAKPELAPEPWAPELEPAHPELGEAGERESAEYAVPEGVEPRVLSSTAGETAFIARRLRELHVLEGVPWADMAVLVRGHHQLTRLRRALTSAGVPVKVSGAEVPLREEPVVRALLIAMDAATSAAGATIAQVTELLMGVFGGIDALALRRIRRRLRHHDPSRSSADSLLAAMESPDLRAAAGGDPGVHRVARMLAAGREAVRAGHGVDMVLWHIWDAAGVATEWQNRALTPGPGSVRADVHLDAAVAIFTVAQQFVERRAGAGPRAFIDHLDGQNFPADSLAARADRTEAVTVHTPVSAMGQHWPVVIVAGVQEDTWPDLRLRDTLLGAAVLADLATRRHRDGAHSPPASSGVLARQEIFHDELRLFLAACSRARHSLIVTAVLDADSRPSVFFERLTGDSPGLTDVPAPLDLRGLVGTLRAQLTGPPSVAPRERAAASLLRELARHGVEEADPGVWHPPWTGAGALVEAGEKVVLHPSAIEQALTCPLQWFLTNHGGRAAQSRAQNLGTLIHDIAKNHPHGTEEELRAELDERWHELDLPDNHLGTAQRTRAYAMVRQLAQYLASHDAPADVEVRFRFEVGSAIVQGQVDRVEYRQDGPHIVDFKTGARRPERDVAESNPQLGAYQLAVAEGALGAEPPTRAPDGHTAGHTGGASLVFVAVNQNVLVREQAPLHQDPRPWAREMVEEAAQIVAAEEFPARPSKACTWCPVRSACPAHADGARLEQEQQ